MLNDGVGSWMARRARSTPAAVALIDEEGRLTYSELNERCARLAHALRGLGVVRGDRVAYCGPNHRSFLETLFAAGSLGATFVPVNFRLAAPEITFALADSGARVLVYAPEVAERVAARGATPDLQQLVATSEAELPAKPYEALLAAASPLPIDEPVSGEETCMIVYTSGTTGKPKGAAITHANVTWNNINVLIDVDVAGDEVSLVSAPLFHSAALCMLCLPTLMKGGTAVLMRAFDPGRAFDAIEAHRVTWMFGVPTMFLTMAQHPRWEGADVSSLRLLMCGGAPVPESLIRTYEARGLAFVQGYGMTEVAPGALLLSRRMTSKIGSAGKAHFFTDVRVARADGTDAAPGEAGEVHVRGPNVMRGYHRREEATAAALTGGWFRSGDVAVMDDDGFFFIKDRLKDMIISGGENIYPAEVEAALMQHPDVAECAVIGVPDEKWGEVGKAFVVPRRGWTSAPNDFLAFLEGKIARYKIPKFVTLVETLPHTGPGKVDKKVLREGR